MGTLIGRDATMAISKPAIIQNGNGGARAVL
jgi:hypothetical protein